jgi:hypothetical protein
MNKEFPDLGSLLNSLEQISRGARAAATRRRARNLAREIEETRPNLMRRSGRLAEAKKLVAEQAANINMGAAAASNWGGEGVPIYGTNYSVARAENERPPRAVSRRSKAPAPTRGRNRSYNNERRRRNERSRSRSRNRATTTRRNNNSRKPASELVAPGKKKSLYDQAVYIVEKQAEPLAANNTKRKYQLSHYERQYGEFTEFLRRNPYNVHTGVISDAIAVLQRKLGIRSNLPASTGANASANMNMGATSTSSASASADPHPTGIFPKDRTIEELLKIRDYMERRGARNGNARNRRANGAKSQNFRRFLGLLYESAKYHIRQLDPENDSMDALHLHSGKEFLDELAQNLEGTPARAPTPQQQEEANELVDELADALAGASMGPATFPNNNNL